MIGLIARSAHRDARAIVRRLTSELDRCGVDYLFEAETASLIGCTSELDIRGLADACELLVVMGGDGTILRVVYQLGAQLRPIFGINLGSLGFLTCLGPQELLRAVEAIATRDFLLSRRGLLLAEFWSGEKRVRKYYALNDVVISRGMQSRLVKLHVRIDAEILTNYNADGLIISTPTGSTAYSLSAGGPILMPQSGAFVVTPICPHVLTNRSVVVSDGSVVEVAVSQPEQEVNVAVDGQEFFEMRVGDSLRVSRSKRVLPLVMLPERSFSDVLRQKLKWSGSNV